jgi:hypothetical protein
MSSTTATGDPFACNMTYKHLNSTLRKQNYPTVAQRNNAWETITRRLEVKSKQQKFREGPPHAASTYELSTNDYKHKNLTTQKTTSNFKPI